MTSWNPDQYLKFEKERLRPALDLLARIEIEKPKIIYDLGCGPGNITKLIKKRWSNSRVIGIDSSDEMLNKAKKSSEKIEWINADLNQWKPKDQVDLLFSNATFHWLDDHDIIFPRLMNYLNPGGILAIQMPNNFAASTHQHIFDIVHSGSWKKQLQMMIRAKPVASTTAYYDIFSPFCSDLDLWTTTYIHILTGENPVVEWTRGSILRPFLNELGESDKKQFIKEYTTKINQSYPKSRSGTTLMPFQRIFMIAKKLL